MSSEESLLWQINRTLEKVLLKLDRLVVLAEISNKEGIQKRIHTAVGKSKTRREIFELCNGKRTVSEIAKILEQNISYVSQQLSILEDHGIVTAKKRGKTKYYQKIT